MNDSEVAEAFEEHFDEECEYDVAQTRIWAAEADGPGYLTPNYCPFCGARVVDDDDGPPDVDLPVRHHDITICECRPRPPTGPVMSSLYERRDRKIRCSHCGNVPQEIGEITIPDNQMVELTISDPRFPGPNRIYRERLYPTGDGA